jgi:hypothetical protein
MNTSIWRILPIILLLTVSSFTLMLRDGEAGEPIFRTNSIVNWEEDLRTFNQVPTDILTDNDGRIYVAFQSGMGWMPQVPYLSHSDDSGATWSRAFRIDDVLIDGNMSNDETSQASPRIAIAPNGTLYAVWHDDRDYTHTQQIRIAWSDDGENFSRSVRIDPHKRYPTYDSRNPSIEINDDGRIIVVWEDRNETGSFWNVYSSYSDDGGTTWSRMVRVNTDNMHFRQHEYSRLAVKGDNVYVTWHDNRGDSGQYRPYLAVSRDGGETYEKEFDLSDDLEQYNSRQWPSPAVDDSGNLYITWRDKRSGFDEIWFTMSSDEGRTFTDNKRVAIVPEGSEDWYPTTAAHGDGIVSVAFQRRVPTKESKDEGEIFYVNSTDGGSSWDKLMRVDDTDTRWHDITTQRNPVMTFDNSGRALVAWADERNGDRNNYYADVWFSRHSGDLSGPNNEPEIYDMEFLGNFSFNKVVGSPVSPFFFSCNYSDEDNDKPLDGYPRIHVFKDAEGTIPLMGSVEMEKAEPGDYDYINGALYQAETSLPFTTGGQLYYRIEVIEERNPDPVMSALVEGPVIDAGPPKITILTPPAKEWQSEKTIKMRARVEDMEGGFVEPGSIKLRRSVTGPDNLDKGIPVTSIEKIDNNTFIGEIDIRLDNGMENYIQFEAKDKVQNRGGSEVINVWIDSEAPFYRAIGPRETQLYERVNCTIEWLDHVQGSTRPSTGVDISTIMYSYRTTSGEYSEWTRPDGIMELANDTYRAWVELDFQNKGIYNFIRWSASDNLGNSRYTHDDPDHPSGGSPFKIDVRIPDNYPPQFKGKAYPEVISSSTPHFFWDPAFDEEGDVINYRVMVLRNELPYINWKSVGERTFYDVSDYDGLDPDWYVLRINASDGKGYDLFDHRFRIVDGGTPPPVDIPEIEDMYTSDTEFIIEWDDTPSWAYMNITYWIRIGSRDWRGDILEWTPVGSDPLYPIDEVDLDVGVYSIQFMAENNGNFSRVTQTRLKVNDYEIEPRGPQETFRAYRGKGAGVRIDLYNWAVFQDNVTVSISGDIVDKGWAYIDTDRLEVGSDRILTVPDPVPLMITVFPTRDAKKGEYLITVTLTSEDGETTYVLEDIAVKVTDKDQEGIGGEITDTLYGVVTDLLPFLKPLSPNLITFLFILFVSVIVAILASVGIFLYRTRSKSGDSEDPYAEQRQLYKELYGTEPTEEQLEEMKSGSVVDEVMGEGSEKSVFDESFLDSESDSEE